MLPLDLHVLSLPLAFILSQDQTLHCIISYNSQSEPWHLLILFRVPDEGRKESTLSFLLYFSVLALVHLPLPPTRVVLGDWKSLPLSLFNELFCAFQKGFPVCLAALEVPPFPKGIAKVRLFSLPPNFFATFFKLFSRLFRPQASTP